MRFCSLGSGSRGNATVVEITRGARTSRVLIDCGFSTRELETRLARAGLRSEDLDAVFITHEHGDHIGCVLPLARRYALPLWMSAGTWAAIGEPALPGLLEFARDGCGIAIGDLQLSPFAVPHDAREPLQLCCGDGARRLGILTDAGSITAPMAAQLQGCDALMLECNHDRGMLAASPYPASVRARISGALGHLSNDSAAQLLALCWHRGMKHLVAAHLSERNNSPALARAALAPVCAAAPEDIQVADPRQGFGWLDLR